MSLTEKSYFREVLLLWDFLAADKHRAQMHWAKVQIKWCRGNN